MAEIKLKTPLIDCSHCNGSGKVPLSDFLLETLCVVKLLKRTTATEVCRHERTSGEPSVNAINNRLEYLRKLGFVGRFRNGKSWIYFKFISRFESFNDGENQK